MITINNKRDGYSTFVWTAANSALGCELLNDKGTRYAGDSLSFVPDGESRGLPALFSERQQRVEWHYNRFSLDAYFQKWNVAFNYESAGILSARTWTRPLIEQNQDYPFLLTIRNTGTTATLPALPFTPVCPKIASLYYTSEAVTWVLDLGLKAAYQYLLDAGISALNHSWQVFDVHDQQVASGSGSITLSLGSGTQAVVTITTPGSGYYGVQFTLTDASGQMLTSSFRTRFTVIHNTAGMTNRLDSLTPGSLSDQAQVAMIGVGGIRESHDLTGYTATNPNDAVNFEPVPGASPALWINKTAYDALINTASAQATLYGLTWWYQMWGTNTVSVSQLQAIAQHFVARYRDRITFTEVENEPNFYYTPVQYSAVLAAFAAGAAAGGGMTLLGPDGVEVPFTIQFMTQIYADGRGGLLGGVSTHTYPGAGESWEQYGNPSLLADLRTLMTTNGDSAKPIWQTEQGYRWDLAPQAEAARYGVRQFLQGWRSGILPNHQYYFYPQYGGFESWYQAKGGEAGSRDSWLPVAAAQRFLAENTHGKTLSVNITTPYRGIYLTRFTGGSDDCIAAWTWDFSYTLQATVSGYVSCVDWMGNPVTPGTSGGDKTFSLSGEPIYIHVTTGSAFTVTSSAFGTNYAAAAVGASASVSSGDVTAANAIDGSTVPYGTRTSWASSEVDATVSHPHWLIVNFGQSRTISRFFALCEQVAVFSVPANWQFQVDVAGAWVTVVTGVATDQWVLSGVFTSVATTRVRLLVTQNNDGWFRTGTGKRVVGGSSFTRYTDGKTRIIELEVYQ
jgi:hypothetical protein